MVSHRPTQLETHAASLLAKTITAVLYYDILDDNGTSLFRLDECEDRHELAWGIDLVLDEKECFGFTWDWFPQEHEYGLTIYPGGLEGRALKKGATRTQESETAPWPNLLHQTIRTIALSRGPGDHGDVPICDCRIDFDGSPSIWICSRQANSGCDANGDDCIVIFSENEAVRLGVRIDAPPI